MKRKIHSYEAEGITVRYERKRCIHALDCVRGLPDVFSMTRRRWIDATLAAPDDIAAIIERCPTGALYYQRKDGAADEHVPASNEARLAPDGPLYLRGNLEIHVAGEVLHETRAALCRCGASSNKPFCDNSHEDIGYQDEAILRDGARSGSATTDRAAPGAAAGVLRVLIEPNGACVLEGIFSLTNSDGVTIENCGPRLSLCRCGKSLDKPLCDGAHLSNGFEAE